MQAPKDSKVTISYIKQYTMHKMTKIHAEHDLTMILARYGQFPGPEAGPTNVGPLCGFLHCGTHS